MSNETLMDLIVNSLAVGVGLVGLIGIWLHKVDDSMTRHRGPLSWLVFLLTLGCFLLLLEAAGFTQKSVEMLVLNLMTMAPVPALAWLYVARLTAQTHENTLINRKHWIAAVCCGLLALPALAAPEFVHEGALSDEVAGSPRVLIVSLCVALYLLVFFGHLATVGILVSKRVRSHRRRLQDVLSETQRIELRWIDGLLIFIVGSIALLLIDLLTAIIGSRSILGPTADDIFSLCVIAGLVIFGLKQGSPPQLTFDAPPLVPMSDGAPQDGREDGPQDGQASYERSSLSDQDCKMLAVKLDTLMSGEKPWLDPFLDLKTLSRLAGSKPYYVTQALNTVIGKNFYSYVNGWRVDEAARLLLESNDNILAICESSGFNSKSTFNSTFRKEKGLTPRAYRKTHCALSAA